MKWLLILAILAGCASDPYISSNPRNMQNMTADEIERALVKG